MKPQAHQQFFMGKQEQPEFVEVKTETRERIQREVDEYLASGGVIEILPTYASSIQATAHINGVEWS